MLHVVFCLQTSKLHSSFHLFAAKIDQTGAINGRKHSKYGSRFYLRLHVFMNAIFDEYFTCCYGSDLIYIVC